MKKVKMPKTGKGSTPPYAKAGKHANLGPVTKLSPYTKTSFAGRPLNVSSGRGSLPAGR